MTLLRGCSIMIFGSDLDTALDLQDALGKEGARVLTAYGVERALLHAETTQLSAVIVGNTLCAADQKLIVRQLLSRGIPLVQQDKSSCCELDQKETEAYELGGIVLRLVDAISNQTVNAALYSNC